MQHLLAREGLDGRVEVESAGTGSWHVGDPPDRRATAEARARGIVMEGRARQFRPSDFGRFDLVVAMDAQNAAACSPWPSRPWPPGRSTPAS